MKITTRFIIKGYKNSVDAAPPREVQYLIKQWWLKDWLLWHRIVDKEEVPMFVIALRPMGGMSGWLSKFAPFDDKGVLPKDHPNYPQKSLDFKSVF